MAGILDELVLLDKSGAPAAIEMLTRAFLNYVDMKYYFPDESARRKLAYHLLAVSVYGGIRYGEAYSTPGKEGVAVWLPPKRYPLSFWMLLRSVPLSNIIGIAKNGGQRLRHFGSYIAGIHHRLVPFPHWYLGTIGVDPQFKGNGYASKLIRPMLKRIDEEGLPCFLETGEEKNVALYKHFGFQVIDRSPVPGTPLTSWAMLRNPGQDSKILR